MKLQHFIQSLLLMLLLTSCSGRDRITVDRTPPTKPVIIPHLGDLGDSFDINNPLLPLITDDNNGIDAVTDGRWIKVSWEHLLDTDLSFVKIFRFDEINPTPVHVASVNPDNDFYVDYSSNLTTHQRYSYFIEVFDQSNNSTVSDTVRYKLLSKQILTAPANGSSVIPDSIKFEWQKSGFVSKFRILVFTDDYEYLWHHDLPISYEGDFFSFSVSDPYSIDAQILRNRLQNYTGEYIYWRVDAFDWDVVLGFYAGSESNVRVINLLSHR